MNKVKCENCKYGVPIDTNERVLLCDNPEMKTFGKNVKHGRTFSCGYGVCWHDLPRFPIFDAFYSGVLSSAELIETIKR